MDVAGNGAAGAAAASLFAGVDIGVFVVDVELLSPFVTFGIGNVNPSAQTE